MKGQLLKRKPDWRDKHYCAVPGSWWRWLHGVDHGDRWQCGECINVFEWRTLRDGTLRTDWVNVSDDQSTEEA